MSIWILMIASAVVISLGEAIDRRRAKRFPARVRLRRPRQYKFN